MKEIDSNKVHREHNLLKVLGIALLTVFILVSIAGAEPSSNITFVTTGSSFSPIITVTGDPTIQWTFGDGSTSNSESPTVNFGSEGTRVNTLVVTPWSAVTKINIGYDGSDGGVTPDSSTIAYLAQQNVITVSGLENVAPYLQVWASSYNPITALNFSNFTALETIECYRTSSLSTIELKNVPSLTRVCFERCNLSKIDLSEAPALEDFRASNQGDDRGTLKEIIWGDTGAHLWHLCIHTNYNMKGVIPLDQFPVLTELIITGTIQKGTLQLQPSKMKYLEARRNQYETANLSGLFPQGQNGEVNISENNLTSLDIAGDPGLLRLDVCHNQLDQEAIDNILSTLDSYDTYNGTLDLTENMFPSKDGLSHVKNLIARGWDVNILVPSNQARLNETMQITQNVSYLNINQIYANNTTLVDMTIIPTSTLNVTVTQWDAHRKVWNESSKIPNTTTQHVIGDFPINTPIQIHRDGVNYEVITSNETGYIDWIYDGGYSEHEFEAYTQTVTTVDAGEIIIVIRNLALGMILVTVMIVFFIKFLHLVVH